MSHCVEQVGLAQAGTAIDEQRVVVSTGLFGDGHGSCPGETVRLAHDEALEAITGEQIGRRDAVVTPRRRSMSRIGETIVEGQTRLDSGLGLDDLENRVRVVPESVAIGGIDQLSVLVAHPAQVEFARRDQSGGLTTEIGLETR